MKSFLSHDRSWAYPSMLLITVCAVALGVWARLYHLGFPPKIMWDEKYFPAMANNFLDGVYQFDLHPPLGKFILAVGIFFLGDEPLGWRIMPTLFGLALLPLVAVLGWYCLRERVAAILMLTFFAVETMFIVHSRTGVMDIFVVFFVLATFLAALRAETGRQVIWTSVFLGLAIAVKWAAFPVAIPAGYVLWRKGLLRPFLAGLWISAVIYIAVIYVGALISVTMNPVEAWVWTWNWHVHAAQKITVAVDHPWGSPWWSWPIMLRPIRFFYGVNAESLLQVVVAIGNPLIWWSSTLAVLAGAFDIARKAIARKFSADDPIIPIVLGYFFLLAPWVPGTRIPYIYNYLPIYPFAILALVYWLCRIWNRPQWGPWVVVGFTVCAVALTLFFLPMVIALPMSKDALMDRVWTDYWLYQNDPVPGSGCLRENPGELCG
ncbi:MAG TPA: phospholipid carrier-dependent glycosyltransferase [Rubrobacter sp.]|nr:phospholipid carrier-dependent glycosyltransferase [Rubrobacter sp.]